MVGASFIGLRRLDKLLASLGLSPVSAPMGLTLTSAPAADEHSPQPVAIPQPAASGAPGFTLPSTASMQAVKIPTPVKLDMGDGHKNAGTVRALRAGTRPGGSKVRGVLGYGK